jgi:thioredoxin-dependent peroxiredoxin
LLQTIEYEILTAIKESTVSEKVTLKVGDLAPDFALPDENGKIVRLSDYIGKRTVIYFYPKDDTTGCTAQACGFRDAYSDIQERNAVVLGISPDDAASHQRFKTKYDLPFTLLVDADHQVAEAYGVWGEKSMYGRTYWGIIRSHFIVDENGRLADVQVGVSPADSVARALNAIAQS